MEKLICNELARCQPATLRTEVFHISSSCILALFSQNASILLLPKRLWKCSSTIFFGKYKSKVEFLVVYLFNYDSSKSTSSCWLWHSVWSSLEYSFYQINWNSSFLAIICRLQGHPSFCSVFWYVLFYKKVTVLQHGGDNNFLYWHLYEIGTFNINLNDEQW